MNNLNLDSTLLRSELRASSGDARRRRSVVLLLALVYIALVVGLLALVSASAAQFARVERHERAAVILRQMIDSGHAWVLANTNDLPISGAVTLDVRQLLPAEASGALTVTRAPGSPNTSAALTIVAQLDLEARTLTRSATFACLPHGSPP